MSSNVQSLKRIEFGHAPVAERITHFGDFTIPLDETDIHNQSLRCLHCGTPYCSSSCPLGNRPVDFNGLVRDGRWRQAWENLNETSNFPEFTSRVCPALCESGCTQYLLEDAAVGIKTIERAIIDRAWKAGWVQPEPAQVKTGKRVAVVGSGPSGLACAQQLARVGHEVTVFEKSAKAGGLLRYGIPDFKLEKTVIDQRLEQLKAEGVQFEFNTCVGINSFPNGVSNTATRFVSADDLLEQFDAVILACGSEKPRDLDVPGRKGPGVHFALELLQGQSRVLSGELDALPVDGKQCDVVIIGGGDTGSDCVGTSRRQGAINITQIDLMPCPPEAEDKAKTWPNWPVKLRTSTSHEEGCTRLWSTATKEILRDESGAVTGVRCVKLEWSRQNGRWVSSEVEGSSFEIPAQRVYLAMGFLSPVGEILDAFGVNKDARGNAQAPLAPNPQPFATNVNRVFACGDCRKGQSLVVHAINEGRQCAAAVDRFLMGCSELP